MFQGLRSSQQEFNCVDVGRCVPKSWNAHGRVNCSGRIRLPLLCTFNFSYITGGDTCSILTTPNEIPDPEVAEAL